MAGLDPTLAGAFIDGGRPGVVLGVELRRFCLWHVLLLQALDSPFLRTGAVDLHDLRTALGICLLRFDDSRIVRPWLGPSALWQLCQKGGLHRAVLAFMAYTQDYLQKPEYQVRAPKQRAGASPVIPSQGAPEILKAPADIIGWSRWPEAHVWSLSPGRALWYQALALKARGADVDFMSERDRKMDEDMRAAGCKPRTG